MMQQQQQPYTGFLGNYLYGGQQDKSFIDKTLAKSDVEEIKDLMQKEDLTRSDLLKILYKLAGTEIKLVNLGEWDRYLLGKFYAWIRDFVASAEILYDYQDHIDKGEVKINKDTQRMLKGIKYKMLHNIKFLCDVFLYLSRSTLSLEGAAFDTITKTRFEYYYPGQQQLVQPETKKGFFNINLGGRGK